MQTYLKFMSIFRPLSALWASLPVQVATVQGGSSHGGDDKPSGRIQTGYVDWLIITHVPNHDGGAVSEIVYVIMMELFFAME